MARQNREGLPDAILEEKRFFELYRDNKEAAPPGWNTPQNWKDLDDIPESSYFGFAIGNGTNYLFIDWDHVINPETGRFVASWIAETYKRIKKVAETYEEVSRSGTGLHMVCDLGDFAENFAQETNDKARIIVDMNPDQYSALPKAEQDKVPKIELFYHTGGRYVYLTGKHKKLYQVAQNEEAAAIFYELLQIRGELHEKHGFSSNTKNDTTGGAVYEIDEATRRRVLEALPYISANNRDEWIRVGLALKNCGWNVVQLPVDKNAKSGWNAGTIILLAKKNGFLSGAKLEPEEPTHEVREPPIKVVSVAEYLTDGGFENDIAYFKAFRDRKTGFRNLDENLTLYPGLAVMGGGSSLGKTTFAVNLADNLIDRGETVLYFSLEQSKFEIVSKSLARKLRKDYPSSSLTNIDIKNGETSDDLEAVRAEYSRKVGNRYHVIEGNFKTTVEVIQSAVEAFINQSGGTIPVVIVDYLQLIAPPANVKTDPRAAIDENIKALKDIQRSKGLFMLLLSNFNRSSYDKPVSYESFKESGLIEYTCDYVFGLQLSVVDVENAEYYHRTEKTELERMAARRQIIDTAMKQRPKEVEFICLKNRNGRQFFKGFFKYEVQHDLFIESLSPFDEMMRDFELLPDGKEIDFTFE